MTWPQRVAAGLLALAMGLPVLGSEPAAALAPRNVAKEGRVTVIAGGDPQPWLAAARRSATVDLLIVVPPTRAEFARLAGLADGRATAGVTRLNSDGAPYVVINPVIGNRLTEAGRGVLISHEAVHAETRSPVTAAPLWVEEGYAEWRAQQDWPEAVDEMDDALAARLREAGDVPSTLPADEVFGGSTAQLAYGRSLLAWRVIADRGGDRGPTGNGYSDVSQRIYSDLVHNGAQGDRLERALALVDLDEAELEAEIGRRLDELRRRR